MVNDPVVTEYVNRIGQNLVRNSDAKVPFTIKVIDTDEVNAFALPGGFFYVNSGLILAADNEAELAGVMAHEIGHVAACHVAREQTRGNIVNLASIPLIFVPGGWGVYEADAGGPGHRRAADLHEVLAQLREPKPTSSAWNTCTRRATIRSRSSRSSRRSRRRRRRSPARWPRLSPRIP